MYCVRVIEQSVINEAGRRLAEAAGESSQVVLFGSRAGGDANVRSDLDFLVVESGVENEAEESVRLARELRDLRVPVDVLVVSRTYVDDWRDVHGSVVHSALAHGRVVAG